MIVSEQMQRSVDHQPANLLPESSSIGLRLCLSCFDRDDDIAEQRIVIKREGEHVGRFVLTAIRGVESANFSVAGK